MVAVPSATVVETEAIFWGKEDSPCGDGLNVGLPHRQFIMFHVGSEWEHSEPSVGVGVA